MDATGLSIAKDFAQKAVEASEQEINEYVAGQTRMELPKDGPPKFDLAHGQGSKWNNQVCRLLAYRCEQMVRDNTWQQEDAHKRITSRTRLPQFFELMKQKYKRTWAFYSSVQAREGETEEQRLARIIEMEEKRGAYTRLHSARQKKFELRLEVVNKLEERKVKKPIIKFTRMLLETLGPDGMSSDDEHVVEGMLRRYDSRKMPWRNPEISKILWKLDQLRQSVRDPRGTYPTARVHGNNVTRRTPVRNLFYRFYEAVWLEERTKDEEIIASEHRREPQWFSYEEFEAAIRKV